MIKSEEELVAQNSADVIHIFLASNDNYAKQLMVTTASICANTVSPLHFHVLDDGISDANRKSIESLMALWRCPCEFLAVDKSWLANFPPCADYPMVVYMRLKIPSILKGVDRCIYLDPDLIVRHDVAELWAFDLQGKSMAAVKDIDTDFLREFKTGVGLNDDHIYFNSGVLLMDLKKLRETDFESRAIEFARSHPERIRLPDQDLLNYLLQDDIEYFPLKWNFCPLWYHDGTLKNWGWRNRQVFYSNQERKAAEEDPAIVHFANRIKPWHCSKEAMQHPYYDEYFAFVDLLHCEIERGEEMTGNRQEQTPVISVIVPCCNIEAYLNKCMDSLLCQTISNIEIIAIDDGSTDATGAMLDDYARWDQRLLVIHKKNGGLGAAYNAGIAGARGKYVGFVEPDDWIAPDMMESLYRKAEETGAEITKCDFLLAYSNDLWEVFGKYSREDLSRETHTFLQLPSLVFSHLGFWAGLYRRDFLLTNGIRFLELPGAGYVDTHFFWVTHVKAATIVILDRPLYFYRITNPNASVKATDRRFFLILENYRQIKIFLFLEGVYSSYKSRLLAVQYDCCMSVFRQLAPQYKEEFAGLMREQLAEIDDVVLQSGFFPAIAKTKIAWLRDGSFYKKQMKRDRFRQSFLGKCYRLAVGLLNKPSSLFSAELWCTTESCRKVYCLLADAGIFSEMSKVRSLGIYKALAFVWRVCVRDTVILTAVTVRLLIRLAGLGIKAGRQLAVKVFRYLRSRGPTSMVEDRLTCQNKELGSDQAAQCDLIRFKPREPRGSIVEKKFQTAARPQNRNMSTVANGLID